MSICKNSFGPCAFDAGPSNTSDNKLSLRIPLTQHTHERYAATLTLHQKPLAVVTLTGSLEAVLQPLLQWWSSPAYLSLVVRHFHHCPIRRVVLEQLLDVLHDRLGVDDGRQSDGQLDGSEGAEDVAGGC